MMLILHVILLTTLVSTVQSNPAGFNETLEKEKFLEFFAKVYELRLTLSDNSTNTSHALQRRGLTRNQRSVSRSLFVELYEYFKRKALLEKWTSIESNELKKKEFVNFAAGKLWDRFGGDVVRKTFELRGSIAGGFAGANLGGVLAVQLLLTGHPVAIVSAGVVVIVGPTLGRELGALGGAIVGDFVNNFIVHGILNAVQSLVEVLTNFIKGLSTSDRVTCRSDMCSAGYAEINCKCSLCPPGTIGKSDGQCHSCRIEGPMKYSDVWGGTICKTCTLGQMTSLAYDGTPVACVSCFPGTFGKSDGKCHLCKHEHPSQYSDTLEATSCKKCPLGSTPYSTDRGDHAKRCKTCKKGTV